MVVPLSPGSLMVDKPPEIPPEPSQQLRELSAPELLLPWVSRIVVLLHPPEIPPEPSQQLRELAAPELLLPGVSRIVVLLLPLPPGPLAL